MSLQVLDGITITPKGAYLQSRFSDSLTKGSWPTSYAFGAWIYQASTEVGFSFKPTEIKMSLVLEVNNRQQKYAYFDINDNDLKCDAGSGGEENLFDINMNGIVFQDMILYSYDISIENQVKMLTVTFRDYSVILDKIYVGLLKRQGATFVYDAPSILSFNVRCPDCQLAGNAVVLPGYAQRDIAYGSYIGSNGNTYDNFAAVSQGEDIWTQWEKFFELEPSPITFDLNGGYLIIGTEEATEERCGSLANVSYSFNELLASLRYRGLNFTGAFPVAISDTDYIYRQNYVGTLRQVLQQWCSDLAYDFYCQGRNFIGINLDVPIDISAVTSLPDPTTTLGQDFAINQQSAILSYKSSTTLDDTWRQAVVMQNNRARNEAVDTKTTNRYVGILPMHPIDFNYYCHREVIRYDAFGNPFFDVAWANSFEIGGTNDRDNVLGVLDGRTFGDIDTSIALTKYNTDLRDIWCGQRAMYGPTPEIQAANFRALGMYPMVEITGEEASAAITYVLGGGAQTNGDEISNLCLDRRFYKVYLGYYYEAQKNDTLQWEQSAAEQMYKNGIVVQGLIDGFPYMPQDSLGDLSPTAGFYGESGKSLLRIKNTCQPAMNQYYQLRDAPFADLMLYSGLGNYNAIPIQLYNTFFSSWSGSYLPESGFFFTQLDNDWGTEPEEFNRLLSLYLDDPCADQFNTYASANQIINGVELPAEIKIQDWRLSNFRPVASPDLQGFYDNLGDGMDLRKLYDETTTGIYDKVLNDYYNLRYKENAQCSKLHLIVIPDTINHPNISVNFNQLGTSFVNPIVLRNYIDHEQEAIKQRAQTETQSICDISLLQEMCKNVISGQYESATGDPRFRCILDEDKYNFLEDGWTLGYLLSPNSRGLNISISKNPIRNNDIDDIQSTFVGADINGDFYYSDIITQSLLTEQAQANLSIIYPVTVYPNTPLLAPINASGANYIYYRGVLQSEVTWENRIPEIVNIYGEPPNYTNNNTSTMKVINNQVLPSLQVQLDPFFERFTPYVTILTGTGNVITTPDQYYDYISQLNSYQLTGARKSVDLVLAGTPSFFGSFQQYLSPAYGLTKMSINVSDDSVTTSLSFSDRPPQIPKQESILNEINSRIVSSLNTTQPSVGAVF